MEISGVLNIAGQPQNGVYMDVWAASVFGSAPSFNTATPSGAHFVASVVSGTAYGQPGAYTASVSVAQDYWVRASYNGDNYWLLFPAAGLGSTAFTSIGYPGPASVGTWSAGTPVYDANNATWLNVASGTPGTWVPIVGKQFIDWPRPGPDPTLAYEYNFTGNNALNTLPTGWAWLNRGGGGFNLAQFKEQDGVGTLIAPGRAGNGTNGPFIQGPYYSFPAGQFGNAWYVTAKLRVVLRPSSSSYIQGGLFVTDGTNITTVQAQLTANTTTPPSIPQVVAQYWNSPTSFGGNLGTAQWPVDSPLYFRLNMGDQWISADGVGWASIGSGGNVGATSAIGVGFFGDQEYGAAASPYLVVSCEWIRVNTGQPPNIIGAGGQSTSIG